MARHQDYTGTPDAKSLDASKIKQCGQALYDAMRKACAKDKNRFWYCPQTTETGWSVAKLVG